MKKTRAGDKTSQASGSGETLPDSRRFQLPDGFEKLPKDRRYRVYVRARFPEIRPEYLFTGKTSPEEIQRFSWETLQQTLRDTLFESAEFEVLLVRDADTKRVLCGQFPDDLSLHRQELLEQLDPDEESEAAPPAGRTGKKDDRE